MATPYELVQEVRTALAALSPTSVASFESGFQVTQRVDQATSFAYALVRILETQRDIFASNSFVDFATCEVQLVYQSAGAGPPSLAVAEQVMADLMLQVADEAFWRGLAAVRQTQVAPEITYSDSAELVGAILRATVSARVALEA